MTHSLRVTDGTTTVTLTSGDLYLAEYQFATAKDQTTPLKETLTVGISRTVASIRTNINDLNRLFAQAANYARNQTGPKVYVEIDPGDTGTFWRSLLYDGLAKMPPELLDWMWGAADAEFPIEWTRQPFFEGALTPVPLSNASDTDNLSGITVSNCYDATRENYVTIAAGVILGDLPAAIKLQLVNSDTDGNPVNELRIFHNVESAPETFLHFIEAESAVNSTDTVTSTTDANCSANAYAAITWSATDEAKIAEYNLPSSDLSDADGGRFIALARFNGLFPYSDMWLRLKLETSTTDATELWGGNLSQPSLSTDGREMIALDTLRLPPYLQGQGSIKELALRLYGLREAGGGTIGIDYLMFGAISNDQGWLWFKSAGQGIPTGETFVHDDIEGITYHKDGSNNLIAEFTPYGGQILLVPDKVQRLYFATCDNAGLALPAQTWTVKLWYRPRRSAI